MTMVALIGLFCCSVAIAAELARIPGRWSARVPARRGWQGGVADRAAGAAGVPVPSGA